MNHKFELYEKVLMTAAAIISIVLGVTARVFYDYWRKNRKRIVVIQTLGDCQRVVNQLQKDCDKLKVLGFDCEWVTEDRTIRPIALLQLSSGDGLCALFRLCCMKKIPKSLRDLLEDDHILKVGITPQDDAHKLADEYGVRVASTFDLRFLAELTGKKPEGLAKMSKSILDIELNKHYSLSCSDWEAKDLSDKQLEYAANDAFVAIEIFKKLSEDLSVKSFWFPTNHFESIRSKLEPFYEENYVAYLNKKNTKKNYISKIENPQTNLTKSQVRGTREKDLYVDYKPPVPNIPLEEQCYYDPLGYADMAKYVSDVRLRNLLMGRGYTTFPYKGRYIRKANSNWK